MLAISLVKGFSRFFQEYGSTLILALIFAVLPFTLPYPALATEIMIYALAAVAFDLCLGYTGLMMFCQASFFGTGVYTTALTLIHFSPNIFIAIFLGILASTILAVIFGFMATRRTGSYMVLLTLAFNELIYFIAYQWQSVTGGDDGLTGVPRPNLEIPGLLSIDLQPSLHYYYFAFFIFLISFIIIKRITISPFGKVIQGIRENEIRAQSIGYNTRLFKLIVFAIGGMFMGLAGSLYAMFVTFAHIHNVAFDTSGNIVLMELIGGMGSLFGPIIGAFVIVVASDVASAYWERWPLILGIICIVFVLFARGGIWGMLRILTERIRRISPFVSL
ncbi:MAG: branched-chain amino acid ABC transporter permease [Deltaproteobacteria bacterium]|nr:MAG: branched-chain amino acid ABC transporter permease [Deltaproteobacteria bacterium]RLB38102.1 MAG: branched-chain amino acid ABC transporter permease [Deltaproteobacteria bacterium]